jgi:release factor glutamine methyltransferase
MKLREALSDAAARLADASDTPRLDAELLLAHALGIPREALLLGGLDGEAPAAFPALLERRLAHEPLAYITGVRDFWTISLMVAPGVLIPRPDSETLIEAAVGYFGTVGPGTVLDLGTGSGALLLAALAQWPEAAGLGVDASVTALEIARTNAEALGLQERARFAEGDWAEGITNRFGLILCNPPYIDSEAVLPADVRDHEPSSALFAGADGLREYRRLIPQLPALLNPGGMIAVEIGATQASAVSALFSANGLEAEVRQDIGGRDRAVVHFSLGLGSKGR